MGETMTDDKEIMRRQKELLDGREEVTQKTNQTVKDSGKIFIGKRRL